MRRNTSSSWVLSFIKVALSCVSCTICSSDTIVMIRSYYCVTVEQVKLALNSIEHQKRQICEGQIV